MKNKVLIVEDDPVIGPMVRTILTRHDFDVLLVTSMADLCAKDLSGVDLAITDFHLPDTDGLEVIHYLREKLPNLPVIFTSGSGGGIDPAEDKNFRVVGKPFKLDELIRAVEGMLRQAGLRN